MLRVAIQHRSRYAYPGPPLLGSHTIRLQPSDHTRARIESYRLEIAPDYRVLWHRDPHGNHVARVTFNAGQRVTTLELLVEMVVEIRPVNPFDFFIDAPVPAGRGARGPSRAHRGSQRDRTVERPW